MCRILRGTIVVLAVVCCAQAAFAQKNSYTYADLVGRLVDLEHLAVLPQQGETCAQWSSWDRASKYDQATGKYVRWDANGDGQGIIRREGEQVVMAEMEGPGCIWRTWSALAQKGHVKIYLDGSTEPTVDLPFEHYFDGKHAPFNYPLISYRLEDLGCRGQNLYVPIPYQKSCKIVADKGWGNYYHFTYSTFPKGTPVPTFSAELVAKNADALANVDVFFRQQLGTDPAGQRPGQAVERKTLSVAPGRTVRVAELVGPRAITALRVKMMHKDRPDQIAALRKLVLQITWDGSSKPAVWCPLGDFFGTAPGENLYKSLTTGMTADGYYALWYMPFAESAVVEIKGDDQAARQVELELTHAPLTRPIESLGHFHAKWHRDTAKLSADRWPDWLMLQTEGRGRFCGVMLHVWNPRGGWWGEGDEKFFVDGEKFPSTFGTGSEDYFGYAWCHPALFQRAYHCQTMTQNNQGHQSVLRWHITDNVPFHKSFEACIEKYYKTEERGTLYACLPIWYLAPGGSDPYEPLDVDQRHGYWVNSPLMCGGFKILNAPKGNVQTQDLTHFKGAWKDNDHLWWTHAKPGDKLELAVPVKTAGKYHLRAVMTKARDYGVVQLSLDGQKLGSPIDLYNPSVIPTEPVSLGTHALTAGEHKLTVEIVGHNAKAVPSYMFGLDQLLLESAK